MKKPDPIDAYHGMVAALRTLGYDDETIDSMVLKPPGYGIIASAVEPIQSHNAPTPIKAQETVERGESDTAPVERDSSVASESQEQKDNSFAKEETRQNIVESHETSIAHVNEFDIRRETTVELCKRIAGGESMHKVCKDVDMPSISTFLRWVHDDAEIAMMYKGALQIRAASMAEDLVKHCDELEFEKDLSTERVQAMKVVINTKQWIMSRLLPKVYGDHKTVEHTGDVNLSAEQLDARIDHLVRRINMQR